MSVGARFMGKLLKALGRDKSQSLQEPPQAATSALDDAKAAEVIDDLERRTRDNVDRLRSVKREANTMMRRHLP